MCPASIDPPPCTVATRLGFCLNDAREADAIGRRLRAVEPNLIGNGLTRVGVEADGRPRYVLVGAAARAVADKAKADGSSQAVALNALVGPFGRGTHELTADRQLLWYKRRGEPEADSTIPVSDLTEADRPAAGLSALPWPQWNRAAVRAQEAEDLLVDQKMIDLGFHLSVAPIAHLDTGFTRHPALGFSSFEDADSAGSGPFDLRFSRDYTDPTDQLVQPGRDPLGYTGHPGHGTRTGSVLAGYDRMAGFRGILPPGFDARVIPFRVTNSVLVDQSANSPLLRALNAAVAAGARVISISLGHACTSAALNQAIRRAYEAGVVICCAAGNIVDDVVWPARFTRVIAVGGTSPDAAGSVVPWAGSAEGPQVVISAPADRIVRANVRLDGNQQPVALYGAEGDGTSYATVHVAAAAAMWLSLHATALDRDCLAAPWKRIEAFREALRRSARSPMNWPAGRLGAGQLDIAALLKTAPTMAGLAEPTNDWV